MEKYSLEKGFKVGVVSIIPVKNWENVSIKMIEINFVLIEVILLYLILPFDSELDEIIYIYIYSSIKI